MYKIILALLVSGMGLHLSSPAQEIQRGTTLEGYYAGTLIKGNSVMHFNAGIQPGDSGLTFSYEFPSWVYYGAYEAPIKKKGAVLRIETFYGEMSLVWDSTYSEIVGQLGSQIPSIQVHLVKMLKPALPGIQEEEISFSLGEISLKGKLFLPEFPTSGPLPCAIFVHGRGCGSLMQNEGRARKLAEYGLATLTFEKRGAEGTGFPCEETSMEQHANDLRSIMEQVAKHKQVDPGRIGLIGYSAGGWVSILASRRHASRVTPAFIVSVVGPSTSVMQQQMDGAEAYVRKTLGLDESAVSEALEYTQLMFSKNNSKKTFARMEELLKAGEAHGWIDVLEESDIPGSADEIKNLWVQRNRYDPGGDLGNFEGPFLGILGEKDDVVPVEPNLQRYREIFTERGKTNYRIRVIPEAGHGLEQGTMNRELPYQEELGTRPTYTKFDRVAPGAFQEIVDFLKKYGFASQG